MDYSDTSTLLMLLILPCLFGLTLIGEGVSRIMNYDNHGWISVSIGSVFEIILIVGYFMLSTGGLN